MRAILDTHVFLWWNADDAALSVAARAFIADGRNDVFLSAASAWEIAIKAARGRLTLPDTPSAYVSERMARHGFLPLSILVSHALHVHTLPDHHRDPFDRMLVAQAQIEDMAVVTADRALAAYDVRIIW